ncbi:hypothetical protein A7981_09830 [Methylovorus sp. MM2]|uniref:DUF3619 family protein n=1 Tax=Methylovorus sp. MM2 TaxID=1848038 RepID=UPI0007E11595|nr:DUF3619 family protein [Methylovorus sp. MM2]OAM51757.1 hypothetical protein A7981_09830 [Methylovorus sp. MM2]
MNHEQDTAKAIISLLDDELASMDANVVNKLVTARQQALSAMRASHQTAMADSRGGVLRLFGDTISSGRNLTIVVLLASLAFFAFITTQQLTSQDVIEQDDAFILGSELPPEAYLDKGFDTWLAQDSSH